MFGSLAEVRLLDSGFLRLQEDFGGFGSIDWLAALVLLGFSIFSRASSRFGKEQKKLPLFLSLCSSSAGFQGRLYPVTLIAAIVVGVCSLVRDVVWKQRL